MLSQKCPNKAANTVEYGCYLPQENKIYILGTYNAELQDIEYTTAAHEMLHAAYFKSTKADVSAVLDKIKAIYTNPTNQNQPKLAGYVASYEDNMDVRLSELHSFIGF